MGAKFVLFVYFIIVTCLTIAWFTYNFDYKTPCVTIEKRLIIKQNYKSSSTIKPITRNKTNNTEEEDYLFNTTFKYLINNRVCDVGNHDITAVIIVTSYYGNVETRSAMRRAFSNEDLIGFDMRRIFLIAVPPESDTSVSYKAILNENERFGDLVQGNFIEAYRNLTFKHTMGLQWAAKYCNNAQYIVKMDDDIVIDMYKVSDYLHTLVFDKNKPILGYVLKGMSPIREPANKWFVTKEEYEQPIYPPFVSGWFYITTPKVANTITNLAKKVPYFWIDDVYITGILARKLKLKHFDISSLYAVHPEYLQCCMQDVKKLNIHCPIMVGPNGGDNNLFFTYNEVMSKCYLEQCKKRPENKNLTTTCVAVKKEHIGHGKSVVESVRLF